MTTATRQLDEMIERVRAAQAVFARYDQKQVDAIFHHAAAAATAKRIALAKMAVEETGMGILEDKVIKNHFASEYVYNKYKDSKTCGLIEDDPVSGYREIAAPLGLVAGIVPTTNPTSTAIFKALLCLKTRNGIIFSPHPRAKRSTRAAAMIILQAAVEAGAPENIIDCLEEPSAELTQHLMSHRGINLILATGGPGMVRAAYSSGTPAIGVGAGNTPVVIDATADVKMAVNSILLSKTFDNGMICASEQTVVAEADIADAVREEFIKRGAWFADDAQSEALAKTLFTDTPTKQGMLPQYKYPWVKGRYARMADMLHLADDVEGDGPEARAEKTARLVRAIEALKFDLGIPASLREAGIAEADFLQKLDEMAEQAFDDQCTVSNPRYPLIAELKELYRKAFYGEPLAAMA